MKNESQEDLQNNFKSMLYQAVNEENGVKISGILLLVNSGIRGRGGRARWRGRRARAGGWWFKRNLLFIER